MLIRHIKDAPGPRRVRGVTTSPEDEVEVDRSLGRRLIQFAHLEVAEELCTERVDGYQCCRELPCQYHSDDEEASGDEE